MSNETYTPTDEDVRRAAESTRNLIASPFRRGVARTILVTIGPIIERERRAARAAGYRAGYGDGWHHLPSQIEGGES